MARDFYIVGDAILGQEVTFRIEEDNPNYTHTLVVTAIGDEKISVTIDEYEAKYIFPYDDCLNRAIIEDRKIKVLAILTTFDRTGKTLSRDQMFFDLIVPTNEDTLPVIEVGDITKGYLGKEVFTGDIFVQGFHTASITATGIGSPSGLSSEVEYSIVKTEISYSESGTRPGGRPPTKPTTEATITVNCKQAGTQTFTIKVTDSRGFEATETVEFEVLRYSPVSFTSVPSIVRCNKDGVSDPTETYLSVYAPYSFSDVGGHNSATAKIYYKDTAPLTEYIDTEAVFPYGSTAPVVVDIAEANPQSGGFEQSNTYDIRIEVTDTAGSVATYDYQLSSAECIVNLSASGKGIGIGKFAEEDDLLDVAWSTRVRKTLQVDGKASFGGEQIVNGMFTGYAQNHILLWENKNPTSEFPAGTIEIPGMPSDVIQLQVTFGADNTGVRLNTHIIPCIVGMHITFESTGDFSVYRRLGFETSDFSTLKVDAAWKQTGTGSWAVNNTSQIPRRIVGVRGKL